MAVTPTLYNIVKSLEGNLLGLDNSQGAVIEGFAIGTYAPYLMGNNLRGLRLFSANHFGMQGSDYKVSAPVLHNDVFDDFLGAVISTFWNANKGSDGTAVAPAINVQNNGAIRLTTGAGSTHTMAVNGSQVTNALTMLVSDLATRFEARLGKISALTSQSICFGLVDVSTLSAPFTRATVTTTANATNACAFLQDSASTNTKLYAVAVNAGGTPQSVALNVDVDTAAFHVYRIEIDPLGNANYFIDGVLVASIALAVATTAVLCLSVGMFSNATSASQTLDIDYILGQNLRA